MLAHERNWSLHVGRQLSVISDKTAMSHPVGGPVARCRPWRLRGEMVLLFPMAGRWLAYSGFAWMSCHMIFWSPRPGAPKATIAPRSHILLGLIYHFLTYIDYLSNMFRFSTSLVPLLSTAARLCGSTRAVGTVELSLIAPLLCICIIGITDVARATALKFRLQQATNRGLEIATIATTKANVDDIQSETAAAAGVPAGRVTLTWTRKCDGVATAYSSCCSSSQETSLFLKVKVESTYKPMFRYGLFGNGGIPMSAYGVVRVE